MSRLTLSVLSLAFLAACQPATTELTEEQKTEIAEAVTQVNADYWAAWARMEDFDEYAGYYSDHSGHFPLVGFESLEAHRSSVMEVWGGLRTWEIQQMELGVLVLGPDEAFLGGSAVSLLTDTTGASVEWAQNFATVWVGEDAEWKLVAAPVFTEVREPR